MDHKASTCILDRPRLMQQRVSTAHLHYCASTIRIYKYCCRFSAAVIVCPQLAKVANTSPRPELAQQAAALAFASDSAAVPARRPAQKRAAAAAALPAAAAGGEVRTVSPRRPAQKKSKKHAQKSLTISQMVAVTPHLQQSQPVKLHMGPTQRLGR